MSERICKEHSMLGCGSCEEIESLTKENELLRGCVEFYADKANWVELGGMNHILSDEYVSDQFNGKSGGRLAKDCLAKLGER